MYPIIDVFGVKLITFPIVGFLALTVCTFVLLFASRFKDCRQDYAIFRIVLVAVLGAAIGGRLLSALTLMLSDNNGFIDNIVHGGSVFYGGLLGGAIGLYIACRVFNLDYLHYTDIFATLLPLAQAIGRIGCYCNGCCYGRETTSLFSVPYIVNGINTRVFPTWLIESFFCLILFVAIYNCNLWERRGARTSIYLISYATFRFFIEFLRGDQIRGYIGALSSSQVISLFLIAVVLVTIIHNKKNTLEGET